MVALDAKVTVDDNALFRHPDVAEMRDVSAEDPQERMAKERGLTYVKLDGNVGILGNGAGLVMSTLDVVAQAGGKPANFLDAGGGSKAEAITSAVEVILSDDKVSAVLFNIFGGITRCDEVARGLIEAFDQIKPDVPFVVRLDGTNDKEGRELLAEAEPAERAHRGDDARRGREGRGAGRLMAILVDRDTRLVVSGITGREGTFHSLRNRDYGTNLVAGVTPGKGGQDVEGVPVFNTFHEAVDETGANTAMVFVPPRFAADSILEAEDAGIDLIITITEGIPAHDELRVYTHLRRGSSRLVGPNCPGILSPGKANVGIIPAQFFKEGNVGLVSRSGTLTYQIGNELAQRGFGNSSIVGIGGDPVPGSSFIDMIELFEADPETELIVMCGEIGGSAEEEAAEYIARARLEAGARLHRGLHGAARQDDGPRRRDRLRLEGHRGGQGRGARGEGRARGAQPHAGLRDRRGDPRRARLARPLQPEPPDHAVVLRQEALVPEAGLLEHARRRARLRERVRDHRRDLGVLERLAEHRSRGGRRHPAPSPGGSQRVAELDDAVARGTHDAAPADQPGRLAREEEARAPARALGIGRERVAHARQRLRGHVPLVRDVEPGGRRVVHQRAEQDEVGGQEADVHNAVLSCSPVAELTNISLARGAPSLDIVAVDDLQRRRASAPSSATRPARSRTAPRPATRACSSGSPTKHEVEPDQRDRHQRLDAGRRVPVRAARRARRPRRRRGAHLRPHAARRCASSARRSSRSRSRPTASTSRRSRVALEEGARPKLAHIIPNFQNPAGCTLSLEKRRRLLELAASYDFTHLRGRPVRRAALRGRVAADDALAGRARTRVVYASSFSKTVCPGIRVGYLVGPERR